MPNQSEQLTQLFSALADPTRRAVLARLSAGPCATSALSQPFNMALPSFTQHLDVLEDCGLVRSRKVGRVRTYELAPQRLETAERWLARQRGAWERRLDQLDTCLDTMKKERT
jgi:DNA-binding transcriptional ArsR family regulator